MYCKNCGSMLNEGDKFCSSCGANNDIVGNNVNKKSTGFWIGLFVGEFVLFMVLLIFSTKSLVGNLNIDGTDVNTFIATMQNNGYSVQNTMNYISDFVIDYYIATKNGYQVDFIVTSNGDATYSIYNQFVNQINSNKGSISSNVIDFAVNDYRKYAITTNGTSYIVAKNDNTVIYADAPAEYREELNQLFDSLGYGNSDGMGIGFYIIMLLMLILMFAIYWKIFVKAGYKGWYSLIPVYNIYIMTKVAFGKGIYLLLMFIPIVNFVFVIMLWYKLAKAFGKSNAFAVCNIFFNLITLQIIAFDDSKYENKAI